MDLVAAFAVPFFAAAVGYWAGRRDERRARDKELDELMTSDLQ